MQKRHFNAMANHVRLNVLTNESKRLVAEAFAHLAEQFNPKFDRARFCEACDKPF